MSAADLADAADLATTALQTDAKPGGTASWAREDMPGHYEDVNVATGVLAAELRVTVEDAFPRLRAHAFGSGQALLDVARAVLARRLRADAFRDRARDGGSGAGHTTDGMPGPQRQRVFNVRAASRDPAAAPERAP